MTHKSESHLKKVSRVKRKFEMQSLFVYDYTKDLGVSNTKRRTNESVMGMGKDKRPKRPL